jgi:O-acetyl-ADP-ribose deacetylase (regulator of RNase III)
MTALEEEIETKMKTVAGDLVTLALDGQFDVIVHGCNCFCTMGAGIALVIQEEFPEAYAADLLTAKGDRNKLGTFSHATVNRNGHEITIINGYTQFHFHGESVLIDYDAVRSVFAKVKQRFSGKRIGYPKIGAGLGGGDWTKISAIIEEELAGEDHTFVIYKPE